MAKQYLQAKNINFREINIEHDAEAREFIQSQGLRTVPQIFMAGRVFVQGGWTGLSAMSTEDIMAEIDLRNSLLDQTL
jgi:glutaredoxin